MGICSKKNPAKLHPDPIWNDGALGFFEDVTQQEEEQQTEDE